MVPWWLCRFRERLPGTVVPLVLLRGLVVLASLLWLAASLPGLEHPGIVAVLVGLFALYGAGLAVGLGVHPRTILRANLLVLGADLGFVLAMVRFTGGVRSVFVLGFYLIAGLQAYYFGTRRGLVVAGVAMALDVALAWPILLGRIWPDLALRNGLLILTAAALGILGRLEREERAEILLLNEELRIRERLARDVVESLTEGVVVLDRDGRVVSWNRAMERRYGLAATAAVHRPLFEVWPGLMREGGQEALGRVLAGVEEEFASERCPSDAPHAGRVVLSCKGRAVRGTDGVVRGVILFVEDLTERVALEDSLRRSDRLAALGTLAAGVTHEINNPIGVITSRIELMLEDAERSGLPASVREDLGVIQSHAHRVARITHSLLAFARHRHGQKVRMDLNRVVEDTLPLVAGQIRNAGVALRIELAPGLPTIRGDPTLLGQVLVNLVNNARDATARGGEITVRTEPDTRKPGDVRLVVHDTGVGIPESHMGRIFEPFFTTKPTGTGLGLAVCYGIVREHDGVIGVHSRPGEGTTFVLSLPGDRSGVAPRGDAAEPGARI